jgi:hypothetical protein
MSLESIDTSRGTYIRDDRLSYFDSSVNHQHHFIASEPETVPPALDIQISKRSDQPIYLRSIARFDPLAESDRDPTLELFIPDVDLPTHVDECTERYIEVVTKAAELAILAYDLVSLQDAG